MQESATRRVFHAVGLRSRWTCLDIGCGPGAVMQLMGELTGPSGEVTGIDRDAEAGREAVERLQATGTSRYRFVEADMESIDEIAGAPFDLTFARLALLHARDPVALLRKMYSWTKPGGYIAVQDIHIRATVTTTSWMKKHIPEACSLLRTRAGHRRNAGTLGYGHGIGVQAPRPVC
jgi:ubiquinone/menaquinone biosynthesis C-methylase UbiE